MRRFLLIFLFLLAFPACAAEFPARVIGVSDGDTLTVLRDGRTQVKVRLHGVDAPETGQPFGSRAKQAASELVFGKNVTVREQGRDRYGRTLGEVILPDGKSLNREQVRIGMSWWYMKYAPHDRDLERMEAEARAAKVGLWSQPGAVPPWDWRKGVGGSVMAGVVGNLRSGVYHRANCPSVGRMSEKNRADYASESEAVKAGLRKAGDCR